MAERSPAIRVGLGCDRHRLAPGLPLVLGGVAIEADVGCVAHSDGDVVLHALTDAILGAIAGGDIGTLFPDSDPAWAGAESGQFVAEALRRARQAGYAPVNIDATVLCQHVRVGPHRAAIVARLAELTGLPADGIGLKAKTGEGVGAVGRGEAIDAQVVVLLAATDV